MKTKEEILNKNYNSLNIKIAHLPESKQAIFNAMDEYADIKYSNTLSNECFEKYLSMVKELGNKIGYGHMMHIASALWRHDLQEFGSGTSGAFIPTLLNFVDNEVLEITKSEINKYDKLIENYERIK
jgi:hypothetical protein